MLVKDCQSCKHVAWMVGIGQGIRCRKKENRKETTHAFGSKLPLISEISDCNFFEPAKTV